MCSVNKIQFECGAITKNCDSLIIHKKQLIQVYFRCIASECCGQTQRGSILCLYAVCCCFFGLVHFHRFHIFVVVVGWLFVINLLWIHYVHFFLWLFDTVFDRERAMFVSVLIFCSSPYCSRSPNFIYLHLFVYSQCSNGHL